MADGFNRLLTVAALASLVPLCVAVPSPLPEDNLTNSNSNTAIDANKDNASFEAAPAVTGAGSTINPALLGVLVKKGILTPAEADVLRGAPPATATEQLLGLLEQKGVLTHTEVAALKGTSAAPPARPAALVQPVKPAPDGASAAPRVPAPPAPAPPPVIAAIAPVRVLPIDPPRRAGLIPDIRIGPVLVKPYGFIKVSAIRDSSSPYGNDFPLPYFLGLYGGSDTGPNASPEFHLTARASRLGTNFEWIDPSAKLTLTGKFEIDFEGNFSAVANRNISSIRSSAPTIRLGYTRLDYAATDKTTVFGEFGQDWTPFGSTTLPDIVETTGLDIGFGGLWERLAMIRGGVVHDFGGSRTFKLSPEAAIVFPAIGNLPSIATTPLAQLGYGERQGADSGRPEVEGRVVAQFQLDKAPGVVPAQLIVSAVQARDDLVVLASAVPTAFKAAFPTGVKPGTDLNGISGEIQLPTRYATLTGKYYRGENLRFFFAGQLFSFFNDTAGLTGTAEALTVDGSSAVVFGYRGTTPTVAPPRSVRAAGGFAEVELPLSRILKADPSGRNAGWTMSLHWGTDQAVARDVRQLSVAASNRYRSDVWDGSLRYRVNQWVTFAYEQSLYRTFQLPNAAGVFTKSYRGIPSRTWQDARSQFATIFTF